VTRTPSSAGGAPALDRTIAAIGPLEPAAMEAAVRRLDRLTKPPGSLGRLETLAIELAGIRGELVTSIGRPSVAVFAGDHGVTAHGVSPYPSEVTRQMVANFAAGGAAINVLSRAAGADLMVVDVGVAGEAITASPTEGGPRLVHARVRAGTRDFAVEPALTAVEGMAAIRVGLDVAADAATRGCDLFGVGEMGIGNTSSASAIVAALMGRPAIEVTGRGTGLDDAGVRHKAAVIDAALARHALDPGRPLDVLVTVGGLEIAALVGAILGAAANRIPVVLDGFITGAAALVAARLAPNLPARLIASHRSAEPGHRIVLETLGLEPILDLGLRLGEGSGAALAIPVIRSAARLVGEMATFEDAGVSNRD
jgi:nicotinate-nucleotide--dimethylbenzimidazole phosphoribosyltransferase